MLYDTSDKSICTGISRETMVEMYAVLDKHSNRFLARSEFLYILEVKRTEHQLTYSAFRLYIFFYQYVCSLGIELTTFCAANEMLYHSATGTSIHSLNLCWSDETWLGDPGSRPTSCQSSMTDINTFIKGSWEFGFSSFFLWIPTGLTSRKEI